MPANLYSSVIDTTKRTSSRVHSSARERNWELEKERTQRGRRSRSTRVRARGTLTFTRWTAGERPGIRSQCPPPRYARGNVPRLYVLCARKSQSTAKLRYKRSLLSPTKLALYLGTRVHRGAKYLRRGSTRVWWARIMWGQWPTPPKIDFLFSQRILSPR